MTQLVVGGGDRVLVAMIHLTDNTLMISLLFVGLLLRVLWIISLVR